MVHPPWVWGEKRQMSHDGIEWECNLQGLLAFLKWRPVPANVRPDRFPTVPF
jgi:hypothetical protein